MCIYLNQCWECKRLQLMWEGHQLPSGRRQDLVICSPPLTVSLHLPLPHAPPDPPPTIPSYLSIPNPSSPTSNWPGSTVGHAVLHGLDEVIISRPLTTSKINSFWNGHNGGLTRHDISIISSSPPLSFFSPLGTSMWFIPGLMRGKDLGARGHQATSGVLQACSPNWTDSAYLMKARAVLWKQDMIICSTFIFWNSDLCLYSLICL